MAFENILSRLRPNIPPKLWVLGVGVLWAVHAPLHALTLQQMVRVSGPSDPFLAEIGVTDVDPAAITSLKVAMASKEDYRQEGVPFDNALSNLRFEVVEFNGRGYINVRGTEPLESKNYNLLLNVTDATGKQVTQMFTFNGNVGSVEGGALRTAPRSVPTTTNPPAVNPLPETAENKTVTPEKPPTPAVTPPPVTPSATPAAPATPPVPATPPAAVATSPNNAVSPTVAANLPQTPATEQRPEPASPAAVAQDVALPPPPAVVSPTGQTVRVRRGQTLSRLVRAHAQERGVSINEALVAWQRANPDAFIGGNVNLLREGTVLQVPGKEWYEGVSRTQADQLVAQQERAFVAYQTSGRIADLRVSDSPVQPSPPARPQRPTTPDVKKTSEDVVKITSRADQNVRDRDEAVSQTKAFQESQADLKRAEELIAKLQEQIQASQTELASAQQEKDLLKEAHVKETEDKENALKQFKWLLIALSGGFAVLLTLLIIWGFLRGRRSKQQAVLSDTIKNTPSRKTSSEAISAPIEPIVPLAEEEPEEQEPVIPETVLPVTELPKLQIDFDLELEPKAEPVPVAPAVQSPEPLSPELAPRPTIEEPEVIPAEIAKPVAVLKEVDPYSETVSNPTKTVPVAMAPIDMPKAPAAASAITDSQFDLVDAYLAIEEKEPAREILQEIIAKGSAEQKQRAQKIMDKLK